MVKYDWCGRGAVVVRGGWCAGVGRHDFCLYLYDRLNLNQYGLCRGALLPSYIDSLNVDSFEPSLLVLAYGEEYMTWFIIRLPGNLVINYLVGMW